MGMLECGMDLKTFKDLGGETWRVRRLISKDDPHWSAFNPSIGLNPDGSLIALFRSSNYVIDPNNGSIIIVQGNKVRNRLYFSPLDSEFKPVELTEIHIINSPFPLVRGVEDAKLYYRDSSWYFTGVIKESDYCPTPKLATFKLLSPNSAELLRIWDLTAEITEKNWMAPRDNKNFDFIYGPTSVVKNNKIVEVRELSDSIRKIRGNTNLLDLPDGSYLSVVHETRGVRSAEYYDPKSFSVRSSVLREYSHRFAFYSSGGVLIKLSKQFCFESPGIEYAAGLILKDGYIYVSYGKKDIRSHVAKISMDLVLDMLEEV
jgi:hypothetical protein